MALLILKDDGSSIYFDDNVWWANYYALIEVDALVTTLPSVSGENYIGQYEGHSYFWTSTDNNYWPQHRNRYHRPSEGIYLLEINTKAEADWLRAQGVYNHYWVGLVRELTYENDWGLDTDKGWVWYKSGVPFPAGSQSSAASATTISETTLLAGSSYTYTVTYTITQSDIETGGISNTILVTALTPTSTVVSKVSDDPSTVEPDDITQTTLVRSPTLNVTKSATVSDVNGNSLNDSGDVVTYTIVVSNTGNIRLSSVTLSDTLEDAFFTDLSSSVIGPVFVSASLGSSEGTLKVGEQANYTASVTITPEMLANGFIANTVVATASSTAGLVSDSSDDPNTAEENDPTRTFLQTNPEINITKTVTQTSENGDGFISPGDVITYTIIVSNTGNLNLLNPQLTDTTVDGAGNILSTSTFTLTNATPGSSLSEILTNGQLTLQMSYTLEQSTVNSGLVSNSIVVSSVPFGQSTPVTDVSDDPTTPAADDPTVFNIPEVTGVDLEKTFETVDVNNNGAVDLGDVIRYNFTITNNGNTDIQNITISDNLVGGPSNTALTQQIATDRATVNGLKQSFHIDNNNSNHTGSRSIAEDANQPQYLPDGIEYYLPPGLFTNAELTSSTKWNNLISEGRGYIRVNPANPSGGHQITDTNYGARAIRGNNQRANTYLIYDVQPNTTYTFSVYVMGSLGTDFILFAHGGYNLPHQDNNIQSSEVSKTFTLDQNYKYKRYEIVFTTGAAVGNGRFGFSPKQYGTYAYFWGAQLEEGIGATPYIFTKDSALSKVATNIGDYAGTISSNSSKTITGIYTINTDAVDLGYINNTATVNASTINSTVVSDTSDDGDDTDGNTTDDVTFTQIDAFPALNVEKTFIWQDSNSDNKVNVGDLISYSITISNTGDSTVSNYTLEDTFKNSLGTDLTYTGQPALVSASQGSSVGTIKSGEKQVYSAQFIINDLAFSTPFISNSMKVIGDSNGLTDNVSDTSNDGDDTDGNTEDDPTITEMEPDGKIEATKTFEILDSDGDGETSVGDVIRFIIQIENIGNTALTSITLVDVLSDEDGNALSLSEEPFFYSSTQSSTVGSLKIGESAYYRALFIVDQQSFDSGSIRNYVDVTASSSYGTNDVTDRSDDGNDNDGNTTDDVTVVPLFAAAQINVIKTATVFDGNGDGITGAGDTINYIITIENTGITGVGTITLVDTLTDGNGGALTLANGPNYEANSSSQNSPEGSLAAGETARYLASYVISNDAALTGKIVNSVTVTATSVSESTVVLDVSDDNDDNDGNVLDDPTEVLIILTPQIQVSKSASVTQNNGNTINDLGDTIVYTITVTNTGNVNLNNLTVSDTLTDFSGAGLTLTTSPTFISGTNATASTINLGGTAIFRATFTINQQAVDTGGVSNVAFVSAASVVDGSKVASDTSDDPNTAAADDKTAVSITATPSIEVTKIASVNDPDSNGVDLGDTITYTIVATNTGDLTLSNIKLTDTLTDANSTSLQLSSGPTITSGSSNSLAVGNAITYQATFVITQPAVDSGSVINVANVIASSPGQSDNVSDTSDDPTTGAANDPTIVTITTSPSIKVLKSVSVTDNGDGKLGKGDILQYDISVENTGDVTLKNVTVTDTLTDGNSSTMSLSSGLYYAGSDGGSPQGELKVGEKVDYIGFFIINQQAVDSQSVINVATGSATTPSGGTVTDTSDDPNTATPNDPTIVTMTVTPSIEVTKTVSVTDSNGDGVTGINDLIYYTIVVENTGDQTLTGITLTDQLSDGNGQPLSLLNGPTYNGLAGSKGSSQGTALPGETHKYTAIYLISEAAAQTPRISNIAIATASSPGQTNNVSDTSDNGNDIDGNTTDDSTDVIVSPRPGIEATKTVSVIDNNSNGSNDPGDTLVYTITIQNTGNVSLTNITLVDTLTDNNDNALSLDSGPTFVSASGGSPEGTLGFSEIATYTATYTIEPAAAFTTKIKNQVTVSAIGGGVSVSDISDNGIDNDGNQFNDKTEVSTSAEASIEAIKTATVSDTNGNGLTDAGDIITYKIGIRNTGGVPLENLSINDVLKDGNGTNLALNALPSLNQLLPLQHLQP